MRLRTPRVTEVQSGDGSAVLAYEGVDMSHDLGGGNYRFRLYQDGQEIEIQARVSSATSYEAEKQAVKEGIDYRALGLMDVLAYQDKFATVHGRRSQVILFEIVKGEAENLRQLAEYFCQMYLEQGASYKYNHPDYPESGEGYYPDEVYFCPIDVDKRLYMTIRAGEASDD